MREIKFRKWHNQLEDMTFWDGSKGSNNLFWHTLTEYPDMYQLMQYTGLKDKKGIDIYEGDVVRILYTDWPSRTDHSISLEDYKKSISHIGEVAYTENARFEIKFYDKKYSEYSYSSIHPGTHGEIEVVGNVFENKNLITT